MYLKIELGSILLGKMNKKEEWLYENRQTYGYKAGCAGYFLAFRWRDLYGKPDFHLGIDIPDELGSPIWAADGGEVIWVGDTPSYGISVRIQHTDGIMTVYAHLDTTSVKVGDKVYRGQTVGTMGRTGVATGNHLHFEVRVNNQTTDPIKYLPEA